MSDLYLGDCREVRTVLADNSVDTIITDPPYGIRFMGKAWDGADIEKTMASKHHGKREGASTAAGTYDLSLSANQAFQLWCEEWAKEMIHVVKPGGFMLVFGGTRTFHRMVAGIEDAGWEIRDCMMWLYGSGFPKSHNLHDKFEGWGTALKPAWEPIIVAMKPTEGTFAENAERWGVSGLNIDGSRIGTEVLPQHPRGDAVNTSFMSGGSTPERTGRWPANLILDEEVGKVLDEQSGIEASRFFYCAKSSKSERNAGCDALEARIAGGLEGRADGSPGTQTKNRNIHPTVKPLKLMEYLCTLTKTPTGGIVLDPFAGSGTTLLAAKNTGREYIGIEQNPEYFQIIKARLGLA